AGSGVRTISPAEVSAPITRDSMVGFSPSSSASWARPSGPRAAIRPSTDAWVGVRPWEGADAFSRRALLLTTPRGWVADSTSSIHDLPVLTPRPAATHPAAAHLPPPTRPPPTCRH